MILQALKEYYDRKKRDLPRYGFENVAIDYVLVLKEDGTPSQLVSTYEGEHRNRQAHTYLVPASVKRSSNIKANLLWDNPEYALGYGLTVNQTARQIDRLAKKHAAFIERIDEIADCNDAGLEAVRLFLNKSNEEKRTLLEGLDANLGDLLEDGTKLSFKLLGDSGLVLERPSVKTAIQSLIDSQSETDGSCLITGQRAAIATLHPSIKGVRGAQPTGANIVSFNQDSFRSYGKQQGKNAPIGKSAAFSYTTALNHLLSKDSRQKMQVGDASTVFWSAATTDTGFEDFFGDLWSDDPDRNTEAVRSLFYSPRAGVFETDNDDTRFYVLGLSPNAARIAVRFWIVSTVNEMAKNIRQHFDDTQIVHGPKTPNTLSLSRLLRSTAAQGELKNIPANIAGDAMRAVLQGLPYPQTLLRAAIRRARAEQSRKDRNGKSMQNVTYERAALIKACLNREARYYKPKNEEELQMCLDENNKNIGYRLGRLFAALERTQIRAFTSGGGKEPNTTIRDRYYGAASGTPITVFATLIRLSKHHLAKIENVGERINMEKLFSEIMEGITDFPSNLSLADQGRFAIGYYHQMQSFFVSKNK